MFAYLHHNQFSAYLRNNSGISKLVIWIDGCGYQNKSADIANSELHVGVETNALVEQKFLTPNHIQMGCGAMHSLIERKWERFVTTSLRCLEIFLYPFQLERKGGTRLCLKFTHTDMP
ncbi:hypothetical protein PoB_000257100 [Plakobranchus ocellatus]|uniref:Uncharacterized protein n=1 Tax=Plakobranchus ocellatus TaxID=259542 RepID=A0AAV3XZ06_9GAST|nr:hypothetical protein PoB_000257100 [Plakobranchus ocellatus]